LHVLHHFLKSHPEVCPPQHPWSELFGSGRRYLKLASTNR
jgi:hypothetical protein